MDEINIKAHLSLLILKALQNLGQSGSPHCENKFLLHQRNTRVTEYSVTHSCIRFPHKYASSIYEVPSSVIGKALFLSLKVLSLTSEMDVHMRMLSRLKQRLIGWIGGAINCAWEGWAKESLPPRFS